MNTLRNIPDCRLTESEMNARRKSQKRNTAILGVATHTAWVAVVVKAALVATS